MIWISEGETGIPRNEGEVSGSSVQVRSMDWCRKRARREKGQTEKEGTEKARTVRRTETQERTRTRKIEQDE